MVDDRAWAELRDGEEPGPREVIVRLVLWRADAPARQIRGQRQPREAVPREEAFARKVPVARKIGLGGVVRLGEQLQLRLSLASQPACLVAVVGLAGDVVRDPVLLLLLGLGRPV